MNKDEVAALVTKLASMGFSGLATSGILSGSDTATLAGVAGSLAGIGFGVYQHWNMKKVPEAAVATVNGKVVSAAGSTVKK